MTSQSLQQLEVEIFEPRRVAERGPPPPVPLFKRFSTRLLLACFAVFLGMFAAAQFGPWWSGLWTKEHKRVDVPSMTVAPAQPAPDMAVAKLGTDASLSATPLALHLVSTSPGRNNHEGTAALGVDARNPQTFGAGALLANGARLSEIYTDHVVLERRGQRTSVYLAAQNSTTVPAAAANPFQKAPRDVHPELAMIGGQPKTTITKPGTVDAISDVLRAAAHFENGKLVGYALYPGARTSAFGNLGLQAGDVLRMVDGAPVASEAQWEVVASALTTGSSVTVSIEREGALQAMTLDASAMNAPAPAAAPPPGMLNGPPAMPPRG